jgi:lantibiotic modifying enzyme
MGLLAAYRLTGNSRLLEQAAACGKYLLEQRQTSKAGWRVWPTIGGTLGTGFSHGAAGIACALLRLYEAGGDKAFLEAGQEAIAYEDSLFSAGESNWPYLFYQPEGAPPVYWSRWCHGAPGIGLGRLSSLPVLDTSAIRRDVEAAILTTRQTHPLEIDHLCCGNFGLIELFVKGQICLDRPELGHLARQWAAEAVRRAGPNAAYNLFPGHPTGLHNAGFFQGSSGIGYQLLRVAYPEKLPSVLLWES